ncbi:2489_t:CDS:2, partial [Acaulospora morrowiae]
GADCVGNLTRRDQPRTTSLGCYKSIDVTHDSLNGLSSIGFFDPYLDRDGNLMDPGLCIDYCASYLFYFSALRKGKECRCGNQNSLVALNKVEDFNCNITCVGNSSYICGGNEAYTVYNATLTKNKIPSSGLPPIDKKLDIIKKLNDDVNYLGCIKDSPYCGVRALNGSEIEGITNMTVDNCIEYCRQNGFKYAGLEIGTQCFCDNKYDSLTQLDPGDCCFSCAGNNSEICGGPLALSVYKVILHADEPPFPTIKITLGVIGAILAITESTDSVKTIDTINIDIINIDTIDTINIDSIDETNIIDADFKSFNATKDN